MDTGTLVPPRQQPVGNRPAKNGKGFSLYDQALLAAKNSRRKVRFSLAVEAAFTDTDCQVIGKIIKVDTYSVQIEVEDGSTFKAGTPWINKSMIVGTEVL